MIEFVLDDPGLEAAGETRDVIVSVGTPPASQTPAIVGPVVGVKSGP